MIDMSLSMRKQILFYSHTGLVSGAERVLLNTVIGLDSDIFNAVIACPGQGNLASDARAAGFDVIETQALNARFTTNPYLLLTYIYSLLRTMLHLRSVIRRSRPELIHANSVRAGLVVSLATAGFRTPLIWHVHDELPRHLLSSIIRVWARLSRRSHLIFVSSAAALSFCRETDFANRATIVHNGIDIQSFAGRGGQRLTFRDRLGVDHDKFLISSVGMINPRKDLIGLIHAFSLFRTQVPTAHLAIVGTPLFNKDYIYLEELKLLVTQLNLECFVHFTGQSDNVPAIMKASDLLVLNARVEPFGLVIVEAMACGVPVLATCVGGIPEIITDSVTGFLTPPGKPDLLAARMLEIHASPSARLRVREEAFSMIGARFSLARYQRHYNAVLFSIVILPRSSVKSSTPQPVKAQASRILICHDNFAQSGGAEKVAEEIYKTLSSGQTQVDMLTTLTAPQRLSNYLRNIGVTTTWMQRLPAKHRLFRAYFLLYPFAIGSIKTSCYDLLITSCFGYAKGVRQASSTIHICYCHTPMRWIWRTEDYFARERGRSLKRVFLFLPLRWLKKWELQAAKRPDKYIANSLVVADRLSRAFGVESTVIYPPIDTHRFAPSTPSVPATESFYLVLSRLVPYKRLDLAIEACTRSGRRLIVIGSGPDRRRLEKLAGETVTFLGRASGDVVIHYAQRCRALIFPGEEDFGMTPLEVNAAGRPVIAYRAGGAVETVVDGLNGVFFDQPTAVSLIQAMERLESHSWDSDIIQQHARQYDVSVFSERLTKFVEAALLEKRNQTEAALATS